ncbi:MAG: voltage-gated potassium channel, partial [Kiritimatiellia bacterium]
GFGDITFTSDAGRVFTIVVLLSGTMFMLVLLPFLFIQFFYLPWMQAQEAVRAPRTIRHDMTGHVVLTHHDEVTRTLITKLSYYNYSYVLVVQDLEQALNFHDSDISILYGDLDDPATYANAGIERAAMVATSCSDEVNAHVAFTVRGMNAEVPIVATANLVDSVDIMQLAGCTQVFQLGHMMGEALARRTLGNDSMTHVIGMFGRLLVAEASVTNTPLVGKTLGEGYLGEQLSINVVGLWQDGRFQRPEPDALITDQTVLVLAGTRSQLRDYDELFCIYHASSAPVVIIGGGRVGRATGKALAKRGFDYRIIEKLPERIRDPEKYVHGSAAELETLKAAGIMSALTVIITSHDDDTNVYLTIYCRRLRPDIQIISRAVLERNVPTLHRAGADFVMSYASMGANAIFNTLKRTDIVMLAEGLDIFRVKVPESLAGKSIADSAIRQKSECTVIAVQVGEDFSVNPDPSTVLELGVELVLIGNTDAEERFLGGFKANQQ